MRFWDVIKEVSTQPVYREASRLFVLALAGDPALVAAARAQALGPDPTPEEIAAAEPYLYTVSPPYDDAADKRLRHADLLVSLPGGPGVTDFRPADTMLVEQVENLVPQVLARRPDLRIALGRQLPGFRRLAAEHVIREVSRVNAEFAAVSGISQSIPFLAPLFPAVAGTDILVLTKNQVFMIFRLAAVYGEDLDLKTRAREVIPVIGSGFGWRAVARQLAGLVPGGLGLPIKAAIAFSGTYATGRAAQMVFDEGRRPTRGEMRRISEEGGHLARALATTLRDRLRRRPKSLQTPPKALPATTQAEGVLVNEEAASTDAMR